MSNAHTDRIIKGVKSAIDGTACFYKRPLLTDHNSTTFGITSFELTESRDTVIITGTNVDLLKASIKKLSDRVGLKINVMNELKKNNC